ncbi:MAG: TonB-dependent receptor, partial [Bacteroidia bacterium]|nr:TonB-dependent receptor [Bacteroidia bacterium]
INGGAAYHYYIEDWIEAGFKVDHFSAKNKDLAFQKFANTTSNLYAGYYFNPRTKIKLDLRGDFDRHYSDSLLVEDEFYTRQAYNRTGANLGFAHTTFEELGLSLRVNAGYDITKQLDDDVKEGKFSTGLNVFKKLSDNINLEIPIRFDNYNFDPDTSSVTFNDLSVNPGIRFKGDSFSGKVSVLYVNGTDYSSWSPVIHIDVPALFYDIDLSLAVNAFYQRNSLSYISTVNPFVISNSISYTPSLSKSYVLKLKRKFDRLSATIKFAYNDYDSVYNYRYNDPDQRFILQTINRSEINVAAKLSYSVSDNASVAATVLKRNFLDDIYPSYVPEWEARFNTSFQTTDQKLRAELELYLLGERPITDLEDPFTPEANLKAFPDLSLNAEYRINKHFGVFLKAVNLLDTADAMLWYQRPVLGRQFWGGVRVNI